MDTITSLQASDREVIPVSEVHYLLSKIHDIMYKAVSKWVGNAASILAVPFNSALGNTVRSGLCLLSLTPLSTVFFLVRLVFIVV